MSTLITITLIACCISFLAKSGGITPFTAGGIAIAYGTINQVSYEFLLYTTITFYLVAYFSNTWAETNSRSMTTMFGISDGANPWPLYILKFIVLIIFMLLPIPKPPFYIQGLPAILIAGTLYYMGSRRPVVIALIVQTIVFFSLGAVFNAYADHNSYSMALIAAVVIPNLLTKPYASHSNHEREVNVNFTALGTGFILTYLTPGFSSSVITRSLFMEGVSQSIAGAVLEAAIEGWALHIMLMNQITTKTVLGDLLSLPELEWSSFTPYNSLKLVILCLPLIAAVITLVTPAYNRPLPVIIPCILLSIQATLTSGFIWSAAFIISGYVISRNKRDKTYTGLIFMTQV